MATNLQNTAPCRPEVLAEAPGVIVSTCVDCGSVAIHAGNVSLRVTPDYLILLAEVLGVAASRIVTADRASPLH